MIRLTMKEERELILAVAMITFAGSLRGKHENPLLVAGIREVGESLWENVFDRPYAEMLREHYPDGNDMGGAFKAAIEDRFPGARSR